MPPLRGALSRPQQKQAAAIGIISQTNTCANRRQTQTISWSNYRQMGLQDRISSGQFMFMVNCVEHCFREVVASHRYNWQQVLLYHVIWIQPAARAWHKRSAASHPLGSVYWCVYLSLTDMTSLLMTTKWPHYVKYWHTTSVSINDVLVTF